MILAMAMLLISLTLLLLLILNPMVSAHSLRLGIEFNTHATPVWIALDRDLFAKRGIGVSKIFKFRTGLELASAIARGDVNVAWACLGPILMIIDKGVKVRIIGKVHNHGYAIVVNSTYIKDIRDLSRFEVYTPGKGSPAYLLLLKVMDKYGVRPKRIIFKPPQTILMSLLKGDIVAASLPEHYVSVAASKGLKVILKSQEVWPNMPGSYLIVSEDLIKEDKEVLSKLLKITKLSIELMRANITYAALISSKALGIEADVALNSIKSIDWDLNLSVGEIQEYIDFMYKHGIITKRLNANDIILKLNDEGDGNG